MAAYNTISNLKDLLKSERTVKQLAAALDRSERMVFRYIKELQEQNCGLRSHKNSSNETVFVICTEKEANLNEEAVKSLEKIKKNLSDSTPADIKNRKLVDKIIDTLQAKTLDEFKPEAITTDRDLVLDYGPFSDDKIQDLMVNKILDAIHKKLRIRMNYKSSTSDSSQTIEVSPVKVIMRMDTTYLIAADDSFAEKGVFKNFLVENISNVTMLAKPVEDNLIFDSAIHYKYAFGKYTNPSLPAVDVTLMIKPTSQWLRTQFEKSHFSPPVTLRKDRNKNDVVDMKIRLTPDFKSWLMGILPDVQIVKPESLKNEMKDLLKKTLEEM